jgi:thermitase
LQENEDVASIESNFPISKPPNPDSLTASSYSPIDLKPKANADGSKLIIGLIDTAVQKEGTGIDGFLLPGISVAGDSKTPGDQPTHGTSMAETMLRAMAALSKTGDTPTMFLPVDVYGGHEATSTFDVAMGIYQAVNNGAQIINLSLGSEASSPFLLKMIQSAHDQGVIFFAAAGNAPVATPTYPAAYPEVIAVTAGSRNGGIAPYANFGSFIDVIAPGSSVVNYKGQSWLIMGTSASTAFASGVAASIFNDGTKSSAADREARIRATLGVKRP